MALKCLLGFLLALQYAGNVLAINEYVFEFGHKNSGQEIYTKDGQIQLLQYNNYIRIPVPPDMEITYVSVTVNALSPPKVDFDSDSRTVSIKYSLFEIPVSTYKIYVKGEIMPTLRN